MFISYSYYEKVFITYKTVYSKKGNYVLKIYEFHRGITNTHQIIFLYLKIN